LLTEILKFATIGSTWYFGSPFILASKVNMYFPTVRNGYRKVYVTKLIKFERNFSYYLASIFFLYS
jgi:hypothetical protein